MGDLNDPLLATSRTLVKDGALVANGNKQHAILFNDVLLLTKKEKKEKKNKKFTFVSRTNLDGLNLFDYTDPEKCPTSTIYMQGKGVHLNLTFSNHMNKAFWLAAFEQVLDKPAQLLDCAPIPVGL